MLEVDAWVTTNNQLLNLSMQDEDEDVAPNGDFSHKLPAMHTISKEQRGEKRNSLSIINLDDDMIDYDGADSTVSDRVFSFKKLSGSLSSGNLLPVPPLVLPALTLLDNDNISEGSSSPSLISRLIQPHSPSSLSRGSSGSDCDSDTVSTGIESLPGWVFEQILLLLGARTTLSACSIVCRRWNKMCNRYAQ